MSTNGYVRINVPKIVHETIDGEAVILNLDSGNYYSLVGAGADIWGLIENKASMKDISGKLIGDYDCNGLDIEAVVNEFISELLKEGLVVAYKADSFGDVQFLFVQKRTDVNKKKQSFETPILNKYTDMQDLLLLDPIHDVDEEVGWPTNKP